jgi:hypothetical protein
MSDCNPLKLIILEIFHKRMVTMNRRSYSAHIPYDRFCSDAGNLIRYLEQFMGFLRRPKLERNAHERIQASCTDSYRGMRHNGNRSASSGSNWR